ncbi:hypothetical protein ACFWCB_29440 [Streptomyces sp. NPDC060048]|uniref:hypothetical protein n=1 Tax=unclassified Streptomyces TaxID=2593676 RepID=UPI0036AF3CF6
MAVIGRRVRFTAVLVGVVLALTGFSSTGGSGSGSSGGSGKSKSSGGSGCSSSKSKPKKKKSIGSGGNGGSPTASPTPTSTALPAHVELVACAGPGRPTATLKVISDSAVERTVRTTLTFVWDAGDEQHVVEVLLKAGESRTMDIAMTKTDKAGDVLRCALGPIETVATASATPSPTSDSGTSGSKTTKPKPKPGSTGKTR